MLGDDSFGKYFLFCFKYGILLTVCFFSEENKMGETAEKLRFCYESVRARTDFVPEVALILGSGLGDFAETIEEECVIEYRDLDGFPVSTVAGHKGRFHFGWVRDIPVVIMQGRIHYYEGYTMQDVVLPTRLMRLLGAKTLFLTNAAGGLQDGMQPGDLMLLTDQIASFVPSPLRGENVEELGPRFPDMSHIYDTALQDAVRRTAARQSVPLKEGVYLQFAGPQYESPAEIRMAKTLGADAVGMSTACEAIAAVHAGMRVCGISCISNLAAGLSKKPLSHAEVQAAADRVGERFRALVTGAILEMHP